MSKKTFGAARIMPDGSVVYVKKGWEPPPDIPGYRRDPNDKWKFLPLWVPCKTRAQVKQMKPCGAITVLTVCTNGECPKHQQPLVLTDCANCPFRKE